MSGVVAVGSAAAAIGVAAAAPSTFAIIGAVGATVGAIGAIAGVKELKIAGAALGAVGGIGAVASGAGLFGTGAEALGSAGSISDSAASIGAAPLGASEGGAYANVGDLMSAKGLGSTDVISTVSGTPPPANTLGPMGATPPGQAIPSQGGGEGGTLGTTDNPAASPGGLINATPASAPAPAPAAAPPDYSGNPPPSAGPYQVSFPSDGSGVPDTVLKPGMPQPTTALTGDAAGSSSWSNILSWIEKHPTLAMAGVTAAGSFLSGAMSPKTPAEVSALNASAAKSTAETGLINTQQQMLARQQSNMQAPLPGATRTRTNTGTGMINRVPA